MICSNLVEESQTGPTPEYFTNYNLTDITTSINVNRLEQLLRESDYDQGKTDFLIDGFTNGFDIGYHGLVRRRNLSENIPLRIGTKVNLWNKVMKEVRLGRYAGPFEEIHMNSMCNHQLDSSRRQKIKRDLFSICPTILVRTSRTGH